MATNCGAAGGICPPEVVSNLPPPPPSRNNTVVNTKVMVVAVAVLFAVVLFILCLHIYAKWFWRNHAMTIVGSDGTLHTLSSRRRRYRGDPRVHHPELATNVVTQTMGLERAFVESLPTFEYSSGDMKPGLECAVCLEEFEEGEQGRTLPKCGHHFHLDCVDMWLHSHSTCPLCRASVARDDDDTKQSDPTVVQIRETEDATVVGDVGGPFMAAMRASWRRSHRSISSPTGLNSLRDEDNQTQRESESARTEILPEAATETRLQPRLQQSLKEYETLSVSAEPGSVAVAESRHASGIRAPFQVTIDIPRSVGSNNSNNYNSSNVMSPMARASASFRRLLSRGKTPQNDEGGPSSSPRPQSPPPPPSV